MPLRQTLSAHVDLALRRGLCRLPSAQRRGANADASEADAEDRQLDAGLLKAAQDLVLAF